MLTDRLIRRISRYRRLLQALSDEGRETLFSHELATLGGFTSAQVRRDIMTIGYTGSPARGYSIDGLIEKISEVLDCPGCCHCALMGVGRLGQAVLSYFRSRNPHLRIVAAFDNDPERIGRTLHDCPCYAPSEIGRVVREQDIRVGIVAVPAEAAQAAADSLVDAGVRSILNFAPLRLKVPPHVYVGSVDITVALERVAFHARTGADEAKPAETATTNAQSPQRKQGPTQVSQEIYASPEQNGQ